ncbi:hypothetical protein CPC08DRAFT_764888 [Agrocybe pediades]|nr:hypothetical protein CPC08DRAFT_764888 [Agrocybe pediades]
MHDRTFDSSNEVVTNLERSPSTTTTTTITYSTELSDVRELEASTNEFENLMNSVVVFYHSKIDDAETQIDAYYSKIDIAKTSGKDFSSAAKRKLSLRDFTASKPFSPTFPMQTPSSDSINSPLTNDTAWVEWFALSPVSSATTSEFLGPTARKSRPDGLKKSHSTTSQANFEER